MVVFFVLRTCGLARNFEPSIRLLAERGHIVHLGFPYRSKGGEQISKWIRQYAMPLPGQPMSSEDEEGLGLLVSMAKDSPNISWGYLSQQRSDGWQKLLAGLRACRDYMRFLEPAFQNAASLRDRSRFQGVPAVFPMLTQLPLVRSKPGRRFLRSVLGACEMAIPASSTAVDEILDVMPDVVLVSRLVDFGSIQVDYVRAAKYLGIPVGLAVASWDNLTNKGLMRVTPDFVTVWNEFQKREAVELHDMAEDRVWVTGAQLFDVWFEREPSTSRAAFCKQFGFDPEQRLIAYLCSSRGIAGQEVDIVKHWLRSVRDCDDPLVRNASVIVRPHPKHAAQWSNVDMSEFGAVEVWPRGGVIPNTNEQRNDFFDTLYHSAAIVGLNTTAQIEAAIIGRPVLVMIDPEMPAAREGTRETLHFQYIGDPEHGIATVADTAEAHLAQLGEALRTPTSERSRKFIGEFVRPCGLDRPAAPFLADAIERGSTVRTGAEPTLTPGRLILRVLLFVLRPLIVALFDNKLGRRELLESKPWLRLLGDEAEEAKLAKPKTSRR